MELFDVASARAFDSAAATAPAGAGGLIYLPYLEGERSPVFDAQAQGVFFGMNTTHKREHFLRAVLEGTACGLSQILDVMREKQQIDELRIIGGGAKSKLWKQILADVCNVTLHDVSTFSDSATSLGAAAAAGVAIGLFKDLPEACSHIRMSGDIEPDAGLIRIDRRVFLELRQEREKLFCHVAKPPYSLQQSYSARRKRPNP